MIREEFLFSGDLIDRLYLRKLLKINRETKLIHEVQLRSNQLKVNSFATILKLP